MAFFRKKDKVIDLTERYSKQQEQLSNMRSEIVEAKKAENSSEGNGIFNMFGGVQQINNSENSYNESSDPEERKRRLGKRLLDLTNKIEDLNNQIYHLQQRIEVLERKNNSGY